MDTVKAVINLGNKSIQLEGERSFVEKYLDQYFTAIQKMPEPTPNPVEQEPVNEVPEKEELVEGKVPAKRNRAKRISGTPTCADRIRALIDEGFFAQLRTSTDVLSHLKDTKSCAYPDNIISANLSNFIKQGKLRRLKEDNKYKYTNP